MIGFARILAAPLLFGISLSEHTSADRGGNTWTVALGAGAGKLFRMGKLPINAQLAAYGNVAKPEFGPDWQLRFQIQFLFPK